jgi:DNA polymerase I-like protein with 3'-5' exonuclease and polymerase domains
MSNFTRIATSYISPTSTKTATGLRLVFDLESDGLLDTVSKVHCLVVADLDSDAVYEYGPDQIPSALEHLSRADCLIGHNILGYDLPLLQRLFDWTPAAGCNILDTLVASRLILPNIDDIDDQTMAMGDPALGKLRGRYSLEAWGIRLGVAKVGAEITDWSVWTPEMQARCVGDVKLTKILWYFLQPDGYSQEALALEHRVASICDRISVDGVPFDVEAAKRLCQQWTARRNELGVQLSEEFPGTNLNSRPQIAALLEARGWVPEKRTEKTKQPCVNDEVLETIAAIYPEFAGLAEYDLLRRRIAQLATGKRGWLNHIGRDGRIHGGLIHIGTPHSRAKHMTPNLAQVPNAKKGAAYAAECRALFRHPGDWVFVTCDQANLQDRAFAHHLAEFDGGAYANAFLAGVDQHWQNAVALGLIPTGTERAKDNKLHTALREGSKTFRYGFLFGAGNGRCGEILRDTVRAAQQIESTYTASMDGKRARERFIAATPGLQRLRSKLEHLVSRQGWLPGLDGRRVPCRAQYTALNYALTSIEAIVCKRWLTNVYDELCTRFRYGWDGDVVITLWVHDEIAACCRPEIADAVGEILVRHAKGAGEHFKLQVPLGAEYKVGKSWAGNDTIETESVKLVDEAPPLVGETDEPIRDGGRRSTTGCGRSAPTTDEINVVAPPIAAEGLAEIQPAAEQPAAVVTAPPMQDPEAAATTEPPPFTLTWDAINAAFNQPRDEAPGKANGHDKGGNGYDHSAGAGEHRSNSHPPGTGDEPHAGKPYGPIRAGLAAKGYRVARSFAFTVPGESEPIFYEDRYELQPSIAPSNTLPRKTCRYRYIKDGKDLNGTGPRRIIYNWPAIVQAGPTTVFITEGANKCDPLNTAGLLATAAPYHQWGPECVSALAGRHLVYFEDHDLPDDNGRITAKKLSADAQAKLAPGAISFKIVPARHLWKNLGRDGETPHGWDIKDWCEAGGEVAKLPEICREIPTDSGGKPVDLWGQFNSPPLPRGLLPPVIERFAFEQGTLMGADPAGLALGALAVCAAALPDHTRIQVKRYDPSWFEAARLWVGLIGDVSTKKSPVMLRVSKPLKWLDAELFREYLAASERYESLSKDDRKVAEKPRQRRLRIEDVTIEAAQEVLRDSPDGVLCIQDELSGWFGSMDKYNSNRGGQKDRGFWLQAFNGGPYAVDRIKRGSLLIENLSISLLGGIQPEPMRAIAADSVDDGLIQRLIPIVLRPAVVGKDEPTGSCTEDYTALIGHLHDTPPPAAPYQFSAAALVLREELEHKHLKLMGVEVFNRKLAAHIGKYDGLFARLCLLWHVIEGTPGLVIEESTARRVADFMHGFLLRHAFAFYAGTLGLADDHERLTAVAGYILAHKLERVTNRDIARGDRTMRGLSRFETDKVFEQLDALGWVSRVPGPRPTDPPHWIVNPEVHRLFAERAKQEAARRAEVRAMMVGMKSDAKGEDDADR